MTPVRLNLEFLIDQPVPTDDLDELADLVREAIDDKLGQTDYMSADVRGYDITFELLD